MNRTSFLSHAYTFLPLQRSLPTFSKICFITRRADGIDQYLALVIAPLVVEVPDGSDART